MSVLPASLGSVSWRDDLDAALLVFLQGKVPDAVELLRWEDEAEAASCDSCADLVVVEFQYRRDDGTTGWYHHSGSLALLIQSLAA